MFSLRKRQNVGIDFGLDRFKLAVVEPDRGSINALWSVPILSERISRDELPGRDDIKSCAAALFKRCQKEFPGIGRKVSASILGGGTISRYMELPALTPKEMTVAVPSQAMKFIPFPMDRITLSYLQVPPISSKEKVTAVFLIAEQNESVAYIRDLVKECCHLDVSRIEAPALSMVREFAQDHRMPRQNLYALVNVGFKLTHVVVAGGRYPYYAREIALAGRDFTYAFETGEQMSWSEAEQRKSSYDAMSRETCIEPFLIRWLEEIRKSLEYFSRQFGPDNPAVERIFLSGGSSAMTGLDQRLEEHMGLPVLVESWENLKPAKGVNTGGPPCSYNVCVGLALEDRGNRTEGGEKYGYEARVPEG